MPAYRPMPWFWWTTRSPTEISLRLFSASLLRFFFFCAPLTPKARAVNTAYFANGRLHPAESCPGRICTNPALGSAAASVVTFSPLVRRSAARPAAARGVPAMTVTAVPPLQSGWMSSSSAATSPPQAGSVWAGALTMVFSATSGMLRAKFSAQSVRCAAHCAQSQPLSA